MPRRERARLLLRGLAKLLVVVCAASAVGVGLGIGLAELSGDDAPPTPAFPADTTSTAASTTPATTPGDPLADVRVKIFAAVLHPDTTSEGTRRQRARLTVRVRAENQGATSVTLERPVLAAAGERVATDPEADTPETHFGPLAAGESQTVSLRIETAGAVTAELTSTRRAQLRIAGRSLTFAVRVGTAQTPPTAAGETATTTTGTAAP